MAMKTRKKWKMGVAGVMVFLFITMMALTQLAANHKMLINDVLGLTGTQSYGFTGSEYAEEDGSLSDAGYYRLIADSMAYCAEQEEEGAVLLYNDGALPLAENERGIALFGKNSTNPIYRSGAGGPIANLEYQVDVYRV